MSELGANLRRLRKARGENAERVAKGIGTSLSSYWKYERGEREPNIDKIQIIAKYFGVSADELLFSNPQCHAPMARGNWIQVDPLEFRCSHCGTVVFVAMYPSGDRNYCPNCGTEMALEETRWLNISI